MEEIKQLYIAKMKKKKELEDEIKMLQHAMDSMTFDGKKFVWSKYGKCYHVPDCVWAKKISLKIERKEPPSKKNVLFACRSDNICIYGYVRFI